MHYLLLVLLKVVGLIIVILMIKFMENILKHVQEICFLLNFQKILILLILNKKLFNNNSKLLNNKLLKVKFNNGVHLIILKMIFLNLLDIIIHKSIIIQIFNIIQILLLMIQDLIIFIIFKINIIFINLFKLGQLLLKKKQLSKNIKEYLIIQKKKLHIC